MPLRAPPVTEALDLPCAPAPPPAPAAPPLWARRLRAGLLSGGGPCGRGPVVVAEGGEVIDLTQTLTLTLTLTAGSTAR